MRDACSRASDACARAIVLRAVVLAAAAPTRRESRRSRRARRRAVAIATRGAIEQWRQAYEVRSVDALEQLYAHDADIVVVSDGVTLIGWTLGRRHAEGPDRAREGDPRPAQGRPGHLGSRARSRRVGRATMTRELATASRRDRDGALTLVLRKDPDGW